MRFARQHSALFLFGAFAFRLFFTFSLCTYSCNTSSKNDDSAVRFALLEFCSPNRAVKEPFPRPPSLNSCDKTPEARHLCALSDDLVTWHLLQP